MKPLSMALVACVLALVPGAVRAQQVTLGPDSQIKADVPHGTTTRYTFKNSHIYPGTERDYWVYVPKQYDGTKPACVMVFQDGGGYQDVNGSNRIPVVFDNLIAKGEMPVTVAVMVNPGVVPASRPDALPRFNRSVEYDTPDDTYARFLLSELLPEVGKTVKLTDDPNCRGLCGGSSGGIASFVAAWFRPDAFRRVISGIGSFVDLRGGNVLPDRIRKHEPKPLRIYLQENENDQDIYGGSWPIANRDMAAALKFAGYDYQFITDPGVHDGRQLGARLPDALRWLWRDYPKPITPNYDTRQPVIPLIEPEQQWDRIGTLSEVSALTSSNHGEIYFVGAPRKRIYWIGTDGKLAVFREGADDIDALAFGPDEKLYALQTRRKRILAFDVAKGDSKGSVVATNVDADQFIISYAGVIYALNKRFGAVMRVNKGSGKHILYSAGISGDGLCLTPDQSLLIVSQSAPTLLAYSFQIQQEGSLINKQAYFDFQAPYNWTLHSVGGMTADTNGWLYVASTVGIQICDQASRVNAVLANPNLTPTTDVAFGGTNRDLLFAVSGGGLYRRKMRAKGVLPFEPPIKPASPRL